MKVTRKFIAEQAGVSATTVSYVINNTPSARISGKVRKRVMAVASKYNYIPDVSAKALVTGKTFNIGFLYKASMTDFISDPFTHEVFMGLEHEIEINDYSLMFAMLEKHDGSGISCSAMRMMRGKFVDGIVICGNIDTEIVHTLKDSGIPFVLIDYSFDDIACNSVMPDNKFGGHIATQYLIDQGCRKIYCLNGDQERFNHPAYKERPAGYRETMLANNLKSEIISMPPDMESSKSTVYRELKKGNIPEAFFAVGDHIAAGCVSAIKKFDEKLLKKIRVIGFDDIQWSQSQSPKLSTVRVPKIEMGSEAVKMLLECIGGNKKTERVLRLGTELIIRET